MPYSPSWPKLPSLLLPALEGKTLLGTWSTTQLGHRQSSWLQNRPLTSSFEVSNRINLFWSCSNEIPDEPSVKIKPESSFPLNNGPDSVVLSLCDQKSIESVVPVFVIVVVVVAVVVIVVVAVVLKQRWSCLKVAPERESVCERERKRDRERGEKSCEMFAWESCSIMQDRWCHLDSTKKLKKRFRRKFLL